MDRIEEWDKSQAMIYRKKIGNGEKVVERLKQREDERESRGRSMCVYIPGTSWPGPGMTGSAPRGQLVRTEVGGVPETPVLCQHHSL